jgi:hypothetical protein
MTRLLQLAFCLLTLSGLAAHAQVGFGVEIPDANAISISSELVLFDLATQGFPPPDFPHHYLPAEPAEPLLVRLYSNITGGWILEADFAEGLVGSDGYLIPAAQLEYSFDGGPWFAFAPTVALYSSQGASEAFEEHTLELRLQVIGNEAPGRYRGVLNFTFVQF